MLSIFITLTWALALMLTILSFVLLIPMDRRPYRGTGFFLGRSDRIAAHTKSPHTTVVTQTAIASSSKPGAGMVQAPA